MKTPTPTPQPKGITERLIVCAAIRSRTTGAILCGARHYDPIMQAQLDRGGGRNAFGPVEQGFIDQQGRFLTRQEAWLVAEKAGQIRMRDFDHGTLYSENLY